MRKILKKIPKTILDNLNQFEAFIDIEKLFEAAINNEKEEDKKKLTQTFANSILMHIKTILSTLNKNFSAEKFLKVVKSDSKKRSLKKQLKRF